MATSPQTDALTDLRGILAAHARDPRARMVQLDKTLNALQAAFDQVERQQATIATAVLSLDAALFRTAGQPWQGITPDHYNKLRAIAKLGQER